MEKLTNVFICVAVVVMSAAIFMCASKAQVDRLEKRVEALEQRKEQ